MNKAITVRLAMPNTINMCMMMKEEDVSPAILKLEILIARNVMRPENVLNVNLDI